MQTYWPKILLKSLKPHALVKIFSLKICTDNDEKCIKKKKITIGYVLIVIKSQVFIKY